MYINDRFQSTGTTSNFGTNFGPNDMNDKTFEEINIRIVTSI